MGAVQITLLPEINREATKKRVEEKLETVRVYKEIGIVRKESQYTPSYSQRFHGPTNSINKTVEEIAISNVMREQELDALTELVDRAIGRLSKKEREIITLRYMSDEDTLDFNVCAELHYAERTYRRIKGSAIYKLAFMLRLEVYEE
ncbi:ArpU family phage packaging/lysis transcriptional regulator [Paenibacillus tarimensis]